MYICINKNVYMIFNRLSLPEMKLIEKCSIAMIESFTRLAQTTHPFVEEFYDAYAEDKDTKLDMQCLIADTIRLWEDIKDYPQENLHKLSALDMLILRMVLTENGIKGLGTSKRNLLDKMDLFIALTPDGENKN